MSPRYKPKCQVLKQGEEHTMATQEIPSTDWRRFCQRFNDLEKNSLIGVEWINPHGSRQLLAEEQPLRSISFDRLDGCNDRIRITWGKPSEREIEHEVIGPIHVKIREEPSGEKFLEIP